VSILSFPFHFVQLKGKQRHLGALAEIAAIHAAAIS
jgi:hypothetical protein